MVNGIWRQKGDMVAESKFGKMEPSMKAIGKTTKHTAKEE